MERRRETHLERSGRQSLRERHSPRGKERGIERERGSKVLGDLEGPPFRERDTKAQRERAPATPGHTGDLAQAELGKSVCMASPSNTACLRRPLTAGFDVTTFF